MVLEVISTPSRKGAKQRKETQKMRFLAFLCAFATLRQKGHRYAGS
jgi:hypothetical protein